MVVNLSQISACSPSIKTRKILFTQFYQRLSRVQGQSVVGKIRPVEKSTELIRELNPTTFRLIA
jgi:hypothetical protein